MRLSEIYLIVLWIWLVHCFASRVIKRHYYIYLCVHLNLKVGLLMLLSFFILLWSFGDDGTIVPLTVSQVSVYLLPRKWLVCSIFWYWWKTAKGRRNRCRNPCSLDLCTFEIMLYTLKDYVGFHGLDNSFTVVLNGMFNFHNLWQISMSFT